jgi:Na+-driven multidrug efflux pump
LNLAFWGIQILAAVQPAKVVNNVLGTGILPSGGDTKFVLLSHVLSGYAIGHLLLHLPQWVCDPVLSVYLRPGHQRNRQNPQFCTGGIGCDHGDAGE